MTRTHAVRSIDHPHTLCGLGWNLWSVPAPIILAEGDEVEQIDCLSCGRVLAATPVQGEASA